jgi:hypothetical protein
MEQAPSMTTRERVDSPVIRRIFEAYKMDETDVQNLYARLERQLIVTYRQVIQAQLSLYGCQKTVTGPDARSEKWIQGKARQDAEGIANTFDRELRNKIQSIYNGNKRSNRFAYMRALDAWIAQRNGYKTASIALNTLTASREYAKDRFITENGIEGKFVLTGPPPVCRDCIRIKGYGAMTYKQTRMKNRRLPAHAGCPHTYSQLIPKAINCAEAWTG